MKKLSKYAIVFYVTGSLYVLLELLFRGRSHIAMFAVAAIACTIISAINNKVSWDFPLIWQSIIGGGIITLLEGLAGLIINRDFTVWDYRDLDFTFFWGHCNLYFSLLWVGLACVAIVLSDWLLYWLFPDTELRPRYRLV